MRVTSELAVTSRKRTTSTFVLALLFDSPEFQVKVADVEGRVVREKAGIDEKIHHRLRSVREIETAAVLGEERDRDGCGAERMGFFGRWKHLLSCHARNASDEMRRGLPPAWMIRFEFFLLGTRPGRTRCSASYFLYLTSFEFVAGICAAWHCSNSVSDLRLSLQFCIGTDHDLVVSAPAEFDRSLSPSLLS